MSRWNRVLGWVLPVLTGVAGLLVWAAVKRVFGIRDFILPGPVQVWHAAVAERAILGEAALTTLNGAAQGFALAALVGFGVAMLLAVSPLVRRALYPHVLLVQLMPIVVLAPLFVIWLGAGLPSVRTITFFIGFFPVVATTTQGLISTDANMVDLFRMANATKWQEMWRLRVPFALPYFLTGLRIAASLAIVGAVTGEVLTGSSAGGSGGLGFRVIIYFAQLKTAALLATAFTACACGLLFAVFVQALQWLLLRHWHESARPPEG